MQAIDDDDKKSDCEEVSRCQWITSHVSYVTE